MNKIFQTIKNKLLEIMIYSCLFLLLSFIIILFLKGKYHNIEENFTYSNIVIPDIMEIGGTHKISYEFESSKIFSKTNPDVKFWIEEGENIMTLSEEGELSAKASGLVVLGVKALLSDNPEDAHNYFTVCFIPIFINQNNDLDQIFSKQQNNGDFQHIKFDKYVDNIIDSYEEKYDYSITESTAMRNGTLYSDYQSLSAQIDIFDEKFGPDPSDDVNEQIKFSTIDFFGSGYPSFDSYLTIFKDNTVILNYKDTDIHVDVGNIKDFQIKDGLARLHLESYSHNYETWHEGASDDEIVWLKDIVDCYSTYYFDLNQDGIVQYAKNTENDFCED